MELYDELLCGCMCVHLITLHSMMTRDFVDERLKNIRLIRTFQLLNVSWKAS